MQCKYCGSQMYVDDREFRFKGNYDIYWYCEKCKITCIEEVRFSQSFKEIWHSENNGKAVDEVINRKISATKQRR